MKIGYRNYLNYTPHPITIFFDGQAVTIKPERNPIRVVETRQPANKNANIGNIPVDFVEYGKVEIPYKKADQIFIVSLLVLQTIKAQGLNDLDILMPGPLVRDDKGNILGCNGLSMII